MPKTSTSSTGKRVSPVSNKRRLNHTPKPTDIAAGSVVILLDGRFKGKRVVFLKQLPSGLLLVTGPYSINGVPLRRVNRSTVISTSVKCSLDGVTIPDTVTDATFKKPSEPTTEEGPSAERKAQQKSIDEAILNNMDSDQKSYCKALFSLSSGDKPHKMNF